MAILRRQRGKNDCGPTCFANALNALGYDIGIMRANKLCNLSIYGTDSIDLIQAFERFGFEAKERSYIKTDKAWAWLIRDTNKGLPLILAVDDDAHWILVLCAKSEEAQIFDPLEASPEKIAQKDLMERWDCATEQQSKYYMGLVIKPKNEKSRKAVKMRKTLLKTADLK